MSKTTKTKALTANTDEVVFYCGETELGKAPVKYDDESKKDSGTAILEYDTTKKGLSTTTKNIITAVYGGSVNLNASNSDTMEVTLKPAKLTAAYVSEIITEGETPILEVKVEGFVGADTAGSLDGYTAPTVTNSNTAVGTYKLAPTGGNAAPYYTFDYVEGTLTISEKAKPVNSSGGGFTGVYNYPIIVDDVDGAAVDLSEDNAVAGETVTITVTPDDGKQVRNVIVTDVDGEVIPVTKVGANEYTFTMPEGKVNVVVTTETVDYNTTIVLKIDSPYVTVNGTTIKNDVAPIINAEGRTMLPIRVIAEALGADVDWNPELQKVTITKDGTVIELFIGKYFAYVNGEIVKLDTAAFIENGRTYLQVRFVSELLGCDVDWDAVTRTVTIRGNK